MMMGVWAGKPEALWLCEWLCAAPAPPADVCARRPAPRQAPQQGDHTARPAADKNPLKYFELWPLIGFENK
jgi:hypothetical protein